MNAEVLAAQLSAVLEDTQPDAVKIGMLGGADQVQAVVEVLRHFRPPNIVLDPVFASSGGVSLLGEAGRQLLVTELMPLCDFVTPNLAEAALLAGVQSMTLKLCGRLQRDCSNWEREPFS